VVGEARCHARLPWHVGCFEGVGYPGGGCRVVVGFVIAFNGSKGTEDFPEELGGLAGEVGGKYVLGDGAHILALGIMNVDCAGCVF